MEFYCKADTEGAVSSSKKAEGLEVDPNVRDSLTETDKVREPEMDLGSLKCTEELETG